MGVCRGHGAWAKQPQMVPEEQERQQRGLDQKPVPAVLWSDPQGCPRSPAGQSGRSRGEGTRSHRLLSEPKFFCPLAACKLLPSPAGCAPGLHPGCAHPSPRAWPGAYTHHAPVGDAQVLGLPWHASAVHWSRPRGAPTMGTVGSAPSPELAGWQAGKDRAQLRSCGPSHPETPAHYLFSLPQEVSL